MAEDATFLLNAIECGDHRAAKQLFPLVYEELRRLAAQTMRRETSDHTLQATALVHEAYVRLVTPGADQKWVGRKHFLAAAAVAMRRILIEAARRKQSAKRGAGLVRQELRDDLLPNRTPATAEADESSLLALDDALKRLAEAEPELARLVELRFFAGLSVEESSDVLGISTRTFRRNWRYVRAWLRREMDRA